MFSSKVMTMLTAVATACFLILLGLQIGELMYYSGDPSVWPLP